LQSHSLIDCALGTLYINPDFFFPKMCVEASVSLKRLAEQLYPEKKKNFAKKKLRQNY
jgi:hypothetical protein